MVSGVRCGKVFTYVFGTTPFVENAVDAVEKAYARCGSVIASAKTPSER
jgi:hypothetical protein